MKKLHIIIIMALVAFTATAQTIGEAFYIYRNDGGFNAFFRDEVQSIEYSNYDADGNYYDEIVTQIVNTPDSIYQIPLATIDSVGFVTPKTEYKPGVINLQDGLQDYVLKVDGDVITFSSSVPFNLLPHVGDKIVTTDMNDFFPVGYAGEVLGVQTEADGVVITCGDVALEDVFECFYGFTRASVQNGSRRKAWWNDLWDWAVDHIPDVVYQGSAMYNPEPFHRDLTLGMPTGLDLNIGNWAGTHQSRMELDFAPRLWVNGFVKIRNDERFFSVTMTGDYSIRESFSHTGKLQWKPSAGLNIPVFSLPVCPFLQVFIEPGLFVNAQSETSVDATFTQHYTSAFHYEWSSNNTTAMEPVFGIYTKENTATATGYVNGELSFGGYFDIGIQAFRKDAASINGHAEIGLSVEGNTNLNLNEDNYNQSTLLYDMLKQSYITGNWYWGTQFEARLTPFLTYTYKTPLGKKNELWRRGYVPSFSNVSFKQCLSPHTSADANLEMRGDCITPVLVGLSVRDQNNQEVNQHYASNAFQNGSYSFPYTFSGLSPDAKYTLHPIVRLGDIEILASPSAEMEETSFPVTLSDFKVTNKQHKEDGFTHNGQSYDYCFNVSITATLDDDAENIAEWGYVYLDPNGQEAFIPLSGHSYTDTRYAYYRNGTPPFTCTLYGYIKYVGSNEVVRGEPHDYSLEYNNRIQIETDYANPFSDYAQLKGHIDNNTDVFFDRCGFLYNTTGDPKVGNATMQTCDINSDGTFEATISNLDEKKVYYYIAFVVVDGNIYYGQTKTLFTIDIECFVLRENSCSAWAQDCYAMASHLGYDKNFLRQMDETWGWANSLGLAICDCASHNGLLAYEAYLKYLPIEQQIYNWVELFYPGFAADPEDEYNQCVHSKSDD